RHTVYDVHGNLEAAEYQDDREKRLGIDQAVKQKPTKNRDQNDRQGKSPNLGDYPECQFQGSARRIRLLIGLLLQGHRLRIVSQTKITSQRQSPNWATGV